MKIRNGFVSNSSSSSFVIKKDYLTDLQIELIKHHNEIAEFFNKFTSDKFDVEDLWEITETEEEIKGDTFMDNFNMERFLEHIGVSKYKIDWEKY